MKIFRILVLLILIVPLTILPVPSQAASPAPNLSDLDNHWGKEFIEQAVLTGLMKGYADGTFKPDAHLTRAQTASLLVRSLKLQATQPAPFTDISAYDKATQREIAAAYEAGIIKEQNGQFQPNKQVTRAQLALMIKRSYEFIEGKPYHPTKKTPFTDIDSFDEETQQAVVFLTEFNLASGVNNQFNPSNRATRGQAAKIFTAYVATIQTMNKGEKGEPGPAGPKGDKGDTGGTGGTGPAGPKGDKGDTGGTGPAGPKGDKGDTGGTGPAGPKGDKGDTGDPGTAGLIIPFASGAPITLTTTLGGIQNKSAVIGFGNSISDIRLTDASVNGFAFLTPRKGTITSISSFFSTSSTLSLVGSTISINTQLYKADESTNNFTIVPGASVSKTSYSGLIATGTPVAGITSGLNIDIEENTRLLLVYTAKVTGGLDTTMTIQGYANAGINFQ